MGTHGMPYPEGQCSYLSEDSCDRAAQKQWKQKTIRPDGQSQCDAKNLFVVGWHYYKVIPMEDDFPGKIIAGCGLRIAPSPSFDRRTFSTVASTTFLGRGGLLPSPVIWKPRVLQG